MRWYRWPRFAIDRMASEPTPIIREPPYKKNEDIPSYWPLVKNALFMEKMLHDLRMMNGCWRERLILKRKCHKRAFIQTSKETYTCS